MPAHRDAPSPALQEAQPVRFQLIIAVTACVPMLGLVSGHAQPATAIHPLTAEQERVLKPSDSFRECDKCPEMVVVPAGAFMMGSPDSEAGRRDAVGGSDEGPLRKVTFAAQFAVGRFAITLEEWDACVADRGCEPYRSIT